MPDYREVTQIGSEHRQFLDLETGKIVECICPISTPKDTRIPTSMREKFNFIKSTTEANLQDCPIHGWA